MEKAIASQQAALKQMESLKTMLTTMQTRPTTMPVDTTTRKSDSIDILSMIPKSVQGKIPQDVLRQIGGIKTVADLEAKNSELVSAIKSLQEKVAESKSSQKEMKTAINSMTAAKTQISDTINKMTVLKNAIAPSFETAKADYLKEIDNRKDVIEYKFQKTMNSGFKQLYLTVTISSAIGLIFLALYRKKKVEKAALMDERVES
jgi:hypothetical protein